MNSLKQIDPWRLTFNTPIECGIRSVAILLAAYPRILDVQCLVQYDYLCVHSGDVPGGPSSLHPPAPYRSGELMIRRSLIECGLKFMAARQVLECRFTANGIGYLAGEYAVMFFNSLTTDYAHQLRSRGDWILQRFGGMSDSEINDYMRTQWSNWGAEFIKESLLEEREV